jgi:TonB-linked SusC/RagA family outer membrane protein
MRLFACRQFAELVQKGFFKTLLIMRLTAFCLFAFCIGASAKGLSQPINLSERNVPIKKIFNEISRQTDYTFVYTESLIRERKKISINVHNASLQQVLDICFKGQPLTYTILDRMVIIKEVLPASAPQAVQPVSPPPVEVRGKVTDPEGRPLAGASVSEKGRRNGTITDAEGNFMIRVENARSVLVLSFVGYQSTEIPVGSQTSFNIVLQQSNVKMGDIVVIGYGTQAKRNLTGAVSTVNAEALENQSVQDVGQALQGQLAGVQVTQTDGNPSSTASITIRGLGTFGANATPLVVVDGIITNYGLRDLNPNDIDNISVLKDASAAAIYGSRGANGVVLVTTKRGRKGKSEIDLSYHFGLDQVERKIPVLTATQFATVVNEYYVNGGSAAPFADPASYGKGTNWQDQIFRTASKNNLSLSFRGGSDKSTYSVGLGAQVAQGVVINSNNTRYSLSVNNDIMPFKGFKVSNSLMATNSVEKEGNPQTAVATAMQYAPTIPAYNADGSFGIASKPGEPITINAPLVEALVPVNSYKYTRVLDNLALEYQILPGLKFRTEGGLEYFQNNISNFLPTYNYGLGNQVTTASLSRNINYTTNLQTNNLLTYTKFVGEHVFDALVGYTFQDSRYEYLQAYRENFSRNDQNLQVLDAGTANDQARGNMTDWTLQSYIGRLNYSYLNRYLFTATLRIDQSSRFISSRNTGYFPSFSAGWIVSDEPFMNRYGALSFLKIRAGYGQLGNQDIGVYPYQASVSPGQNYVFGIPEAVAPGYAPTSFVNQDISWEKTTTTGVGADAGFFSNRLRFIIDYYNRHTSGILLQVPIPEITGNSSVPAYQNAGDVTNRGFEFTISYGNAGEKKRLSYDVSLNFTTNHNEVTGLGGDQSLIYTDTRTVKGQAINSFYGYVMDGIFQNQSQIDAAPSQPNARPGDIRFKDLNGDHVIDANDRKFIGSTLVAQTFGFNGQLRYNHFDLSVVFVAELGRKGITRDNGFDINRAGEQNAAVFWTRWTGEGSSNTFPRLVAGDPNINERPSTFYLASRDYLRLKNLQIGYNILLRKSSLRNFRVYLAAQNLFTITKWPGFDPELNNLTSSYPLYRSLYAGINIGL